VESGFVKLHCKIQLNEVANSYATVYCIGAVMQLSVVLEQGV